MEEGECTPRKGEGEARSISQVSRFRTNETGVSAKGGKKSERLTLGEIHQTKTAERKRGWDKVERVEARRFPKSAGQIADLRTDHVLGSEVDCLWGHERCCCCQSKEIPRAHSCHCQKTTSCNSMSENSSETGTRSEQKDKLRPRKKNSTFNGCTPRGKRKEDFLFISTMIPSQLSQCSVAPECSFLMRPFLERHHCV